MNSTTMPTSAVPQRTASAKPKSLLLHPAAKVALFAVCLLPFAYLF